MRDHWFVLLKRSFKFSFVTYTGRAQRLPWAGGRHKTPSSGAAMPEDAQALSLWCHTPLSVTRLRGGSVHPCQRCGEGGWAQSLGRTHSALFATVQKIFSSTPVWQTLLPSNHYMGKLLFKSFGSREGESFSSLVSFLSHTL